MRRIDGALVRDKRRAILGSDDCDQTEALRVR
jgi:hypothetical protein